MLPIWSLTGAEFDEINHEYMKNFKPINYPISTAAPEVIQFNLVTLTACAGVTMVLVDDDDDDVNNDSAPPVILSSRL